MFEPFAVVLMVSEVDNLPRNMVAIFIKNHQVLQDLHGGVISASHGHRGS